MLVPLVLFPYATAQRRRIIYFLFSILFFIPPIIHATESTDLVVHFETNGRELNPSDQKRLKEAFKNTTIGPETKILVVGYTDSTGTTNNNYALSRSRANAVKNHLIGLLKLDASKIVAVGRGAESPASGNDTPKNRALNRRAEVFILGTPGMVVMVTAPWQFPPLPDPKSYMDLLEKAQRLVKIGKWEEALIILRQAKEKGAEYHSLWHLLQGVIGYFQGVEPARLIAYFENARELDPDNLDALDFLGRSKARRDFELGLIAADMGRSAATAIKVETISQEHELIRLFQVDPLYQKRLSSKAIDVWQCQTINLEKVDYYFDISAAYPWAFRTDNPKQVRPEAYFPNFFP